MGIVRQIADFVWPEQRAKDPFASRSKSIWQTLNELDSFDNVADDGWAITAVYTACMIYGQAMASLDFGTYMSKDDKKVIVDGDPVTKLFTERINSYMNPHDWFITSMLHWGITGNAMSYIVRDRSGTPKELILLDPHNLTNAELKDGKKLFYYSGLSKPIEDKNMFHIAGPGWDGILGRNPIEAHRAVMNTNAFMIKYIEKFFENGAHLKYVLEKEGIMEDDEYNNLLTSWHELYAGPDQAGKTAILEDGVKIKPLSLSPVDAAYLQIYGNITKNVANIYRLPLYLFNEYQEGAKYDNVEYQDLTFVKYSMVPMVTKWEQEIKRKLYPPNSNKVGRFDLFSLLRGDMDAVSDYANKFFTIGALNQDEIRRKFLNMNPLPDGQGKKYYVQGNNMVPIDKIDEIYEQKMQSANVNGGRPGNNEVDTDLPTVKEA